MVVVVVLVVIGVQLHQQHDERSSSRGSRHRNSITPRASRNLERVYIWFDAEGRSGVAALEPEYAQ